MTDLEPSGITPVVTSEVAPPIDRRAAFIAGVIEHCTTARGWATRDDTFREAIGRGIADTLYRDVFSPPDEERVMQGLISSSFASLYKKYPRRPQCILHDNSTAINVGELTQALNGAVQSTKFSASHNEDARLAFFVGYIADMIERVGHESKWGIMTYGIKRFISNLRMETVGALVKKRAKE